jgi:hypothetical protein
MTGGVAGNEERRLTAAGMVYCRVADLGLSRACDNATAASGLAVAEVVAMVGGDNMGEKMWSNTARVVSVE